MASYAPLLLALVAATAASPTSTEIAPGVFMPFVNLGGVRSRPSNYTAWFEAGGIGVDTALTYGVAVQTATGKAVAAASLARSKIFVTTKVPCCPEGSLPQDCGKHNTTIAQDAAADLAQLGLDYVDLLLLHWPCDTIEQTIASYKALEPLVASGKVREGVWVSPVPVGWRDTLHPQGVKSSPTLYWHATTRTRAHAHTRTHHSPLTTHPPTHTPTHIHRRGPSASRTLTLPSSLRSLRRASK